MSKIRLTKPQLAMLARYEHSGVTTQFLGRIDTWSALVRKGCLRSSWGPGSIETEITPAGRAALSTPIKPEQGEA